MVEISSDMSMPKDIDTVRVQILSGGESHHDEAYGVGPGGLQVPATIGVLAGSDPSATALVRITAIRRGRAIVLREATTEIPSDRIALLRLPLHFLCEGSALDTPTPGTPADPTIDAITEAKCPPDQTCAAGACIPSSINVETLPTYVPPAAGGGAVDASESAQCFDTVACFAGAVTARVQNCSVALPAGVNPADVNVAIQTTDGQGICAGANAQGPCFVPLDEDPVEGWQIQGSSIALPQGLCAALGSGSMASVVMSASCPSKKPGTPTCGPWSSVSTSEPTVDGGSLPMEEAGADSSSDAGGDTGAVVSDAGDASTDAGVDAGGVHLPTCATYCSHDIVQRSDDSLWLYSGLGSAPGELQGGNGPFLATSFDTGGTTVANALLCGVAPDRTVWCGIVGSAPSQILTAAGGPALADATSVSVDPFGAMACAVGASGGVWCWGNGLYGVGQGTTTSSTYALPVLSQSGGTPFAGATKLQADSHHVCALKTDGAVWCWGENTSGALGVGSTQATVSYPTQIPSLTNVVDVVGELNNSCALKADGTVWCWGDNSYGSLGNPAASGSSSVPVQVMAGQDGGAALSGVSSISGNGNGPGIAFWALRDSDHSIWAWGDGYSSSAAPATAGGNPITDAAVLGGGFCFLDQAGVFHELGSGGGVASQAIACPGTGPGQSCVAGGPGLNNCGAASESCCTSLPVATGTYFRTYTNSGDGGTGEADPASVSSFRLDKYLVTLGRFRQFANAVLPPDGGTGWLPGPGAGKHAHLNGGQGLVDVGASTDAQVVYEKGWQSAFDANVAPTDANLTSACDTPAYATWTHAPGTQENLPVNCVNWYEAYAFCIWDGGFLPSEAEWEYAAAGGNEQRQYPWGSTPPGTANQYAIFNCNYPSGSGTCTGVANVAPVGTATLGAGLWGQLDLAGDLSEYELDSYAPFMSPCIDCANLSINATSAWADRGGWFNQVGGQYLPAWRRMYGAGRGISTGIRCARAP